MDDNGNSHLFCHFLLSQDMHLRLIIVHHYPHHSPAKSIEITDRKASKLDASPVELYSYIQAIHIETSMFYSTDGAAMKVVESGNEIARKLKMAR